MALSKSQQSIWERSRALGSGGQAVGLGDEACAFLIATIAKDLGLRGQLSDIPVPPPFFSKVPPDQLVVTGIDARGLYEKLVLANSDADTYYACLASLHKSRLKYDLILKTQVMPTLEQIGPRGLLQYGQLSPTSLAGLLFWRKWLYDIDNRAAQETGYLFEPIIAHAVGGTPCPASRSPVKRHSNKGKGRQVDCLLEKKAYEFKIRVTIAASGQGRWREELDFPVDCKGSGYIPVLVVLDGTPNPKLAELEKTFLEHGGEVYKGEEAWKHLDNLAGQTMATFVDKYVRRPIDDLIAAAVDILPDFHASMNTNEIVLRVGNDRLSIPRQTGAADEESTDIPCDVVDDLPGI